MDYISGNLKQYIYQKKLTIQEIVELSQQLIKAVSVLHESGIIHRDLKPENILIKNYSEKRVLKIIDFG